MSLREYWRYSPRPKLNYKTRSEYVEHFDELFSRVMSETVQARGPVGVLLSGGIDSSYVALKAKEAGAEIKAVSLFVPDSSEMDERKYSRSVAGALGMESIEIDASDCWSLSSGAISDLQFDQPYHPMQAPALMLACEAARQDGMQVLLDGAGGDELFTGGWDYAAHLAIQGRWAQAFREVRDWSSDAGVSTLRALRYAVFSPLIPASVRAWVRRLGGNAVPSPVPPWLDPIAMRACRLDKALDVPTLPPVWQTENRAALFWAYFLADVLPAMAWWERHASLPNGVEARSPLWDLRVIEFVLGTPEWVHRSGGRTKAILREAMAGRLPAEVQNRADKGLFSSLMYRGIADNETERVRSALRGELSELIYVKPSVLEREFEVLCERRHIWWTPIWRAVTAGLWLQSDSVSCGQSDGRSVLTASGRRDD
ncbi:MAG TPA: asparagine synthase C-terminal domain-containing protein [Dehalococcoidia bacterium]|nr:asparagine synthase C-terminal domain-containing protein [Dehalococcoidia bacterium]